MKYYKIIMNNSFIGITNSGSFIRESETNHRLFYADELCGQYMEYNRTLYRDYWMIPTISNRKYLQANITEITEEEYNTYITAINNNEEIIIDDGPVDEQPIIVTEIEPDISVEFIRSSKIQEMSRMCRNTIEAGFDLELRGETKHFSLATQDQLNLMSLGVMAQTQSLIPYHADEEECDFYTTEEINEIIDTANAFKIYHTTYYNALKGYINSLETIEDIAAVTYGMDIPEEYQTNVLKALEA